MVNQIFNVWKACWTSCVFIVDSTILAEICARFDALDEKISAQSTLLSEQISQLQSYMERGFSLIDGQMLCNMDQLHALEDFVHKHLS